MKILSLLLVVLSLFVMGCQAPIDEPPVSSNAELLAGTWNVDYPINYSDTAIIALYGSNVDGESEISSTQQSKNVPAIAFLLSSLKKLTFSGTTEPFATKFDYQNGDFTSTPAEYRIFQNLLYQKVAGQLANAKAGGLNFYSTVVNYEPLVRDGFEDVYVNNDILTLKTELCNLEVQFGYGLILNRSELEAGLINGSFTNIQINLAKDPAVKVCLNETFDRFRKVLEVTGKPGEVRLLIDLFVAIGSAFGSSTAEEMATRLAPVRKVVFSTDSYITKQTPKNKTL